VERPPDTPPVPAAPAPRAPEPVQRWRLFVRRRADASALAQREWQAAWEDALAASGLPVAFTDGVRSRPRLAIGAPLTQGLGAEREPLEILLTRRLPIWAVREALLAVLPEGHELTGIEDVWLGEPALSGRVLAADYEAVIPGLSTADAGGAVAAMLGAAELPRDRVRGERVVRYDLRPFVGSLEARDVAQGCVVRMRLRHDPEKGVGRPDEVLAELGDRLGRSLGDARVVRTGLVLAELRAEPSSEVGARRLSAPRGGRGSSAIRRRR
jgi:radical SAM-linked protein